jgi:hypothetical protein
MEENLEEKAKIDPLIIMGHFMHDYETYIRPPLLKKDIKTPMGAIGNSWARSLNLPKFNCECPNVKVHQAHLDYVTAIKYLNMMVTEIKRFDEDCFLNAERRINNMDILLQGDELYEKAKRDQ